MRILIFGDSVTQATAIKGGGWADRLRDSYERPHYPMDNDHSVLSLGVGGDATDNMLTRFKVEALARKKENELVIIFAVGVNDSRIKNGNNYMEDSNYLANLRDLFEQAKELSSRIAFVGLTPCIDELSNPVSWSSTCYQNERIRLFDNILNQFCLDKKVSFIEVFNNYQEIADYKDSLPDGIHPDSRGHEFIFGEVKRVIDRMIA